MNLSNTNSGGWESSHMRNDICPQFLELLPTDLQNVIGTTTKYTDNVGGTFSTNAESNITATKDKIFLLSYYETGFTSTYCNTCEADYTEPYSDIYNSDNSRIKYRHSNIKSASLWWLRSPRRSSVYSFCATNAYGSNYYGYGDVSNGFSPAIVIY